MLADLAMRAGQRVVVFDLFGDLDLRRRAIASSRRGDLSALVDAAVAEPPGAVVYGASFENHPALVDRLAERHTLLGNSPGDAARRPRSRPARRRAGRPPVPATSGTRLRPPAAGCASRCAAAAGSRVQEWRSGAPQAGTFLQERIDGIPCSAAAVGDATDAVVLGHHRAARRTARVRRRRLPLVRERRPAARAGGRAAGAGARGLLPRRGRVRPPRAVRRRLHLGRRARWTIEVNPRPTASLEAIEAAYGTRVFDAHPARLRRRACVTDARAGKAVLFATEDVTVGDTSAGWSAGCATSRTPASGSPRAVRSAPSSTTAATPDEVAGRARAARRAAAGGAARGGGGAWLTRPARGAAARATTSRSIEGQPLRTCSLGDTWFAERSGEPAARRARRRPRGRASTRPSTPRPRSCAGARAARLRARPDELSRRSAGRWRSPRRSAR